MESKSWMQRPSNALGISVDLDALRTQLQKMSAADLLVFGEQMRQLVYEARAEWRRRRAAR
jgi:hypothetical protein